MFIRVKTNPKSKKRNVQIVETVRKGNRVRHIGAAVEDYEIDALKKLAQLIMGLLRNAKIINGELILSNFCTVNFAV